MLFNSLDFLIFFPIVCFVYFLIPHRVRYLFLLGASYYFYMCWNPKYALLMLTSTGITYVSGLLIGREQSLPGNKASETRKKIYVGLSFSSNLLILFIFKYLNFAINTVIKAGAVFGVSFHNPQFDIILPVGISFYTFQALSYTMDVYRGELKPERNFLKYALFVSFFPQLVAGPIERSKNLIHQISEKHTFELNRVLSGLTLMLYGLFQKVVLAEYLALLVDRIYDHCKTATGYQLLIATICFAFQIYCDFDSYSNIAIGAARVMGFRLMENFNTPYFSQSVSEFWRRWHISLSTWFRDYLYIPLGGSRKGNLRKNINRMIVFVVSGLWHGASWHFVVWGFLNGIYQVIGDCLKPLRERAKKAFRVKEDTFSFKVLRILFTFTLIDISWVFFRAPFRNGVYILQKIATFWDEKWFSWDNNLKAMGLTTDTRWVLIFSLLIVFIVDLMKYLKVDLIDWFLKQQYWFKCLIYYFAIFGILVYGIYGPGFDASEFIYFQF